MKARNPRGRSQSGSALIEFAIGASVFVFLFTGTFQFGYSFYVYNNIANAVRSGARYAALANYPLIGATVDNSPSSAYVTAVQNVTVYGKISPAAGDAPIAPGLSTSNVIVNVAFANGGPDGVSVKINNFTINSIFGTWPLAGKPLSNFTYTGHWSPPCNC